MEITLKVNPALVLAVVLGELVSVLWFADNTPWGRHGGHRYFIAAILSDIGLVLLLQFFMQYYSVGRVEEALALALFVALLYGCLEAPHLVHDSHSAGRFFYIVLHKFAISFVMVFSLFYFKNFHF